MNRLVVTVIILAVLVIWFSALANACGPGGSVGGSYGPPIWIGGGGGWDRGGFGSSSGSSGGSTGSSSPSRSSGGTGSRGGGISGGSGGK